MNTFQSLLVSTTTVLLIFVTLAHTHPRFMHNGVEYDDKFYELFSKRAPVKHIIKLAVDWDANKQWDHFKQLNHHIASNDEAAKYAQSIVDATRKVLQLTLDEVKYPKNMTLEQYLDATRKIQNEKISEVEPDILEGIQLLDKVPDDTFEKLLNEGATEELNWELDNLHPYDVVPNPKIEIATKQQVSEENSVPESPVLQQPNTEQDPKESISVEPQVSQESVPKQQAAAQKVLEDHEEVEEVIAEPPKSDDVVPDVESVSQPQTSEETGSTSQETKEKA